MTISPSTAEKIRAIANDDVSWETTMAGLMPVIVTPAIHSLIAETLPIDALLVERLKDPDAYVAAHVILTQRWGAPFTGDVSCWNELRVNVAADGTMSYDAADREPLYELWSQRLGADGRLQREE